MCTDFYKGYIGLISIKEVTEVQKWKFPEKEFVVCDRGLQWLSILPQDNYYCITAMMNEKNDVLVWYIDMIAAQGIDTAENLKKGLLSDIAVFKDYTKKCYDIMTSD